MRHYRLTPAFSMLELIFVIVILGIVASIGSEMIVKVYESYIVQRAEHRATLKTELVATQIANRLRYAIPHTAIRKVNKTSIPAPELVTEAMTFDPTGNAYTVLQWVAYDGDSFKATATPGWSGFCDINVSNTNTLSTPGSSLDLTNTIIGKLSNGTKTIADATLFFPYDTTEHNISTGTGETITLDSNASRIVEHYKLAWTSYALVVEPNTIEGGKDLYLYYNFSPIRGVNVVGTRSLLMKNISTFKFKGAGRTIRFKICKQENIGEDFNITACKEKAVF